MNLKDLASLITQNSVKLYLYHTYICLLVLGLCSYSSFAESFAGIIVKKPLKTQLLIGNQSIRLVPSDGFVEADLRKLKTGDFLQGFGQFDKVGDRILVSSVDIVGLRNLLGKWISEDEMIVDFTGFSLLNVYIPSSARPDGYRKPYSLSYSLSPDEGNNWGILLNSSTEVQTGLVHIEHPDRMSISVRDVHNQLQTIVFQRQK